MPEIFSFTPGGSQLPPVMFNALSPYQFHISTIAIQPEQLLFETFPA
jgi:hypothetical protein